MFFGLMLSFLIVAFVAGSPYNNADHDTPTVPVEFFALSNILQTVPNLPDKPE